MKHFSIPVSAILVASLFSSASFALDYREGVDYFSDARTLSTAERAAVSALFDMEAISGNPDRSFAPDRTLNRAEFTKIAMLSLGQGSMAVPHDCFPDLRWSDWFSPYVCWAKRAGAVQGNPDGRFHPERPVNYAEAIKILVELAGYDLPEPAPNERWTWYTAYSKAAQERGVQLPGNVDASAELTRGQMARLAAAFVAEKNGELDEYRDAENGTFHSFSSSRMSSSSSSSRSTSLSSRSSSFGSFSSDPDTDLRVRSNFLLLGDATPVLGAVDFFAQSEPVDVRQLNIRFASNPTSIQQVRVYAEDDGRLLGTSLREPSGDYEIPVVDGALRLPHRAEFGVYVRALMKPADGGASGGQIVQIEHIEAEGDGVWSDGEYTVTTTQTFLPFETAPAAITVFQSTGAVTSSVFIPGGDVTLGNFEVRARSNDNDYTVEISLLTFRVAKSSEVSLSDVKLTVPGSGASSACTVSTGSITCDSIPLSVGTIDDEQLLRLTADVTLADGADDPYLQVTFQSGGSPTNPGDIVWTDGRTTYDWLAIDEPVARGIRYQ